MRKLLFILLLFFFTPPIYADYIDGPANMREKPSGQLLLNLDNGARIDWDTYYENWYFISLKVTIKDEDVTDSKIIKKGAIIYDFITDNRIGTTLTDIKPVDIIKLSNNSGYYSCTINCYTYKKNIVREKRKIIESIEFDFNFDGKKDLLSIGVENDWVPGGDPGDYFYVSIKINGESEFELGHIYEWIKYEDYLTSHSEKMIPYVKNNNLLKSPYIFLKTIEKPSIKQSLLFLTGHPYASSPGSLMVIFINNLNSVPEIIFNEEEFSLSEIMDVKDNSNFQIIGRKSYSQGFGCDENGLNKIYCSSYDPYSVYELVMVNNDTSFKINYDLSKKYNEIN